MNMTIAFHPDCEPQGLFGVQYGGISVAEVLQVQTKLLDKGGVCHGTCVILAHTLLALTQLAPGSICMRSLITLSD